MNPHLHLHLLVTDGVFDDRGGSHPLLISPDDLMVLRKLFEQRVLRLLLSHQLLSRSYHNAMLSWDNTGFSVDGSVKVGKGELTSLQRLLGYMARPPITNERLHYNADTGEVKVFSSKKVNGRRPWVATYDALTFMALLAKQVPPQGVHMVRYYGWYSSRSRAKRRQASVVINPALEADPPYVRERRKRWAELLRRVFEVDPLTCTFCGGELKIVSFITKAQPNVIHLICEHLGESTLDPRSHDPPTWLGREQQHVQHPAAEQPPAVLDDAYSQLNWL